MEIIVTPGPPAYILRLTGRWDAFSAKHFEELTADLVQDGRMRLVVLDLARVDYISSFALRSLLNLGKLLDPLQGAVHVAALCPAVMKMFTGSGFDSMFPAHATVDAALAALAEHA